MKLVEYAIYELIKTYASGRVYAMRAPQNAAAPFVIFQRTGTDVWRSIRGPAGISQATIQIDVYAETYYAAKALAAEIQTTLDGYRGTVYYGSDSPQPSITIGGVSVQEDFDLFDQTETPFLYRSSVSYLVTFET